MLRQRNATRSHSLYRGRRRGTGRCVRCSRNNIFGRLPPELRNIIGQYYVRGLRARRARRPNEMRVRVTRRRGVRVRGRRRT